MKTNVTHEGDYIHFLNKDKDILAYTDYDEILWDTVSKLTWSVSKNKYLYSHKIKKSLHQVVMDHLYGEGISKHMYHNKGYIIDHIDNNGFNCKFNNLTFLKKSKNTSKGMYYDKERKDFISVAALNIFKIIESNKYQITIGFNKPYYIYVNGDSLEIAVLYLVYNDRFNTALGDAEYILEELKESNKLDLSKLKTDKIYFEKTFKTRLSKEEKKSPFFIREEKIYINLDCDGVDFYSVPPLDIK